MLNRSLPASLALRETEDAAEELAATASTIGPTVAVPLGVDEAATTRVLAVTGAAARNWAVVARREAALRERLSALAPLVVTVPNLDAEIGDLDGVHLIALHLAAP